MKKIGSKILQILPFVFLGLAILMILQIVVSIRSEKTPSILGYGMFVVESPSMEDVIMTGDLIFINTKVDEYNVHDIITFHRSDDERLIITHEIIDKVVVDGKTLYTTKGVNNSSSLDWEIGFDEDLIIGKYVGKSAFLGDVYNLLFKEANSKNFIYAIVILVFMMIAIMEVSNIVKEVTLHKQEVLLEEKNKLVQIELEKLKETEKNKEN